MKTGWYEQIFYAACSTVFLTYTGVQSALDQYHTGTSIAEAIENALATELGDTPDPAVMDRLRKLLDTLSKDVPQLPTVMDPEGYDEVSGIVLALAGARAGNRSFRLMLEQAALSTSRAYHEERLLEEFVWNLDEDDVKFLLDGARYQGPSEDEE